MPHRLLLTCTWVALGVAPALGQADYVDSSALNDAELVKYWQLRLPLEAGQELADSYLVDDHVYAATRDGFVYAIHSQTGAIRWRKQVTSAGYRIRRPCHVGNLAVFVTPPTVLEYDRFSGRPIRKIETRFPTGSAAISDGIRFYLGGIDQKIYAFYPEQGFEIWKARADGQIVSRPALLDRYLYFAGENGSVYACVAHNKRFYWRSRVTGSITADLVVDQNGVYVATHDNSLFLLDPSLGGRRWRARFSGPLTEAPVVTLETAYQYCPEDGVAAINTGTVGIETRVRWILPRARKLLTVDEHRAYLLSRDESILVARLDTGKLQHSIPAPGFTMPMSSPNDFALYIASRDGRILCARRRGVPPVRAEDVLAAVARPSGSEGPEAEAEEQAAKGAPSEEDLRESKRPGPPVGGKSKVTREYTGH